MKTINVKIPPLKSRTYKIQIGSDFLSKLWPMIEKDFPGSNYFIITDENIVKAGHLAKLLGKRNIPAFIINPPGELSKNINTATAIIETMEKASLGRDTTVVALGGGTVGDIAGFAAAIFKRGVPVTQIPTTTVAQADSAIGGKTGVDSSVSKNAFGVFWQPSAVYIDTATLKTLSDREFKAGLVESIKHAIIADKKYFDFLENNIDAILQRQPAVLEKIAYYNCKIKASVVQADPTEKNQRRMLNYGHTIGHAVESAGNFELLHGEAVVIGIIAAGLIEIEMKLSAPEKLQRIKKLLEKLNLPVKLPPNLSRESLIETIKRDKKAVNKWPKFVLTDKIGHIYCKNKQWAIDVAPEVVEKILDKLL